MIVKTVVFFCLRILILHVMRCLLLPSGLERSPKSQFRVFILCIPVVFIDLPGIECVVAANIL